MSAKFPALPGHDFAVCMNCGAHLRDVAPRDDGYPAGRGRYAKRCPHCDMSTWYDLAAECYPDACRIDGCGRETVPGMATCAEHWRGIVADALASNWQAAHSRRPSKR